MRPYQRAVLVVAILLLTIPANPVAAASFGDWEPAETIESLPGSSGDLNTEFLDGCPIQSPDGMSLYMATNRPGGLGGIDIWVAHRSSTDEGFGAPENLGAPVNSDKDDFCPTPVLGKGLFFVSRRDGGCAPNSADLYVARFRPATGWSSARNLGCTVNSAGDEFSPSYVREKGRGVLYFSSNRGGNHDIYRSVRQADGSFGTAQPVDELNTTSDEFRPNVSKDGREIVFDSNRAGGLGATDIYAATRASVGLTWSAPSNLGPAINSAAAESRASLSKDRTTLVFGSTKAGGEGATDIYITFRDEVDGP